MSRFSSISAARDLSQPAKDPQPTRLRALNHLVGALGGSANPKHGIAAREDALGDRMEDFIERRIADTLRSGEIDQRQGEPFAKHRNVAGAKERERKSFHSAHIRRYLGRVVAGARPIRARDQDHE
jgi:hypothetical protein